MSVVLSAPGSGRVAQPFGFAPHRSERAAFSQGTIAEPVNTATGNYLFQRTDLAIPARGLPLIFKNL